MGSWEGEEPVRLTITLRPGVTRDQLSNLLKPRHTLGTRVVSFPEQLTALEKVDKRGCVKWLTSK